jgi:hypothetical protein
MRESNTVEAASSWVDQSLNGTYLDVHGGTAIALRRHEIALEGSGLISLGRPGTTQRERCVRCSIRSGAPEPLPRGQTAIRPRQRPCVAEGKLTTRRTRQERRLSIGRLDGIGKGRARRYPADADGRRSGNSRRRVTRVATARAGRGRHAQDPTLGCNRSGDRLGNTAVPGTGSDARAPPGRSGASGRSPHQRTACGTQGCGARSPNAWMRNMHGRPPRSR